MSKFTARAYNSFEISDNKNSIIKKSQDKKLYDEAQYYINIPNNLSLFFPRLVNHYQKNNFYFLELEYYAYEDLGLKMIYDDFDLSFWKSFFNHVDIYFESYKKSPLVVDTLSDSVNMFIKKTYDEYIKLINNFDFFNKLVKYDEIIFNGQKLKPFEIIWDKIKDRILTTCISDEFYYFHGDFCFNNVLCGINKKTNDCIFKFIDPRGKFGDTNFYGDFFYDLAKLSHSCNGGYEYFINDEFKLTSDNNIFNLEFSNINYQQINEVFLDYVNYKKFNLEKIKIIEGCVFIGMCARHYDNIERQKSMYLTGLKILNDIYENL